MGRNNKKKQQAAKLSAATITTVEETVETQASTTPTETSYEADTAPTDSTILVNPYKTAEKDLEEEEESKDENDIPSLEEQKVDEENAHFVQ